MDGLGMLTAKTMLTSWRLSPDRSKLMKAALGKETPQAIQVAVGFISCKI